MICVFVIINSKSKKGAKSELNTMKMRKHDKDNSLRRFDSFTHEISLDYNSQSSYVHGAFDDD